VQRAHSPAMCPMRIFVLLFSILVFLFFVFKWNHLEEEEREKRSKLESQASANQSKLRKFVSLFTGEYIYRKLKWEWKEAKEDEEDDDEEEEEVATGAPCTVAN